MSEHNIVTFGIPLMASWAARDWGTVLHQLDATIGSIYAQTDPNFRIIVVGTGDPPQLKVRTDERYQFIQSYQLKPMNRDARMMDGVQKRHRAAMELRKLGGGYLMLTDADDLISRNLVAYVRKDRHKDGYIVSDAYMFDAGQGLMAPFPFPNSPKEARFHQECGTSAMPFFTPAELPRHEDDNDNRYARLLTGGHPTVYANAIQEGRPLKDFAIRAVAYVRNTGENLSTEAAFTQELQRIPFQAFLDDGMHTYQVKRTPEIDAEFNLPAAETNWRAAPQVRRYQPPLGLSVLISTYKRPAGLRRLLTALRPQVEKRVEREIVVVNDGSHDEEYAGVVAEFADIIRYAALEKNQGIVAARNATLKLCYGTYAVFTDDDCVPPPYWLDWVSARLRLHPEIDVLAGTTTPHWKTKSFRERVLGAWFIPRPWRIGRRDIFVTANVAIRSDLLRGVGAFGFEGFAGAGEDTELSLRLHRARARFLVDHMWTVEHDVDQKFRSLARKYQVYGRANAIISHRARITIPPPAGMVTFNEPMNGFRGLLRFQRHLAMAIEGGPAARAVAAATGAWIQSSYVKGYRGHR